jgi:hypothetical protein
MMLIALMISVAAAKTADPKPKTPTKWVWACSGSSYELLDPKGLKKAIKQKRCKKVKL